MKPGPGYVIDHMSLYQMFSDAAFFTRVPVFYFMKDQATQVVAKIVESVLRPDKGCPSCHDVHAQMKPLQDMFTRHVVQLQKEAPVTLQALVDYVSEKRGVRPTPIVLYFREGNGSPQRIEL